MLRTALLLSLALLAVSAGPLRHRALFNEFKSKYGRNYASAAEEQRRFAVFSANMEVAAKYNQRNPFAHFGMNNFSDISEAEFKVYHNLDQHRRRHPAPHSKLSTRAVDTTVSSIDWRQKGAVTRVKNQGQCGSCWAFSATASIEGQWFLAGHPLISLSEQEIVSCDTTDDGCNGGDPISAYKWLLSNVNGNLATDASDPYESAGGSSPGCNGYGTTGATITGHERLQQSEHYMASWCAANGPVSICIDATSFQSYTGGVMTNCVSQQVDHCVLVVGFDQAANPPYWIIKNSWGTSWGEAGYIRVEMFTDQCLITTEPNSATVPSVGPTPPPTPPQPSSNSGSGSNPTPAPPTPPPPAPSSGSGSGSAPPLPPAPAGSTWTQFVCPDYTCLDGCQPNTFSQGQCLQLQGGGSAIAVCTGSGILMNVYGSSSCSGSAQQYQVPINQCAQDQSGSYVYNECGGGSNSGSSGNNNDVKRSSALVVPSEDLKQLVQKLRAQH